jgi:hypothetical protein
LLVFQYGTKQSVIQSVIYLFSEWENRLLRRVFGTKKDKILGAAENFIVRSLTIYTPHQILLERSFKEGEMYRACSMYWREAKCIQAFVGKDRRKETTRKT